jgi:hypothetical protein
MLHYFSLLFDTASSKNNLAKLILLIRLVCRGRQMERLLGAFAFGERHRWSIAALQTTRKFQPIAACPTDPIVELRM